MHSEKRWLLREPAYIQGPDASPHLRFPQHRVDSVKYGFRRPLHAVLSSTRLHCHPASPCALVSALRSDASVLPDGGLQLHFALTGDAHALRIPQPLAHSSFADELWRHTCFEAFVGTAETTAYREFNFAPSGAWAAYAFSDYRQRDMHWQPAQAPCITSRLTADGLSLDATIPAVLLPAAPSHLHIGLTAVMESSDGTLSYWALSHPGERPDFHQRASFMLRLAPQDMP